MNGRATVTYLRAQLLTPLFFLILGCGGDDSRAVMGSDSGAADGSIEDVSAGNDGNASETDGAGGESGSLLDARGAGDASASRDEGAGEGTMSDATGATDAAALADVESSADVSGDQSSSGDARVPDGGNGHAISTVFLILMENHDWSAIKGSASAPYINGTLLPSASHAEQYYNPPAIHPSLPNYLWLEAGQNFGILDDNDPSTNHQATTMHLVTQMTGAGVTWRAYEEDIPGTACPLSNTGNYAVRHDPFVYFDDITTGPAASCTQNVRPYTELAADLAANSVARYNFITPNVCDDMHDDKSNNSTCASTDSVRDGDTWLSTEVPKIQASAAYKNGGAIFITWDEGEGDDGPIGMIVLSPLAKGAAYSSSTHYSHSSTLRTMQTIFGLSPFLGDAANATDLRDLFATFP